MNSTMLSRVLLAFALVSLIGAAAGTMAWHGATGPARPGGEQMAFTVPAGANSSQVARVLQEQGIIRSAKAMRLYLRLYDLDGKIRAGEYDLSPADPMPRVVAHLISGKQRTYAVSLPEGLTAREIGARLAEAGLVELEPFLAFVWEPGSADALGVEGPGLEGYLFPETYHLQRGLSAERVAGILVAQFKHHWQTIEGEFPDRVLSQRETVTLASIVEKETGAVEERPLIAAVFLNRMKKGMRLETDPTVIYGIPGFDGNLTRAHLQDANNPYNTYKIKGLPPGPIANPGAEALRAVLAPADSPYLYFVSTNDGRHHFSTTYREHVNAVNRYQRWGNHRKKK